MPVPLARGRGYAWVDQQDHAAVLAHRWGLRLRTKWARTAYAQSTFYPEKVKRTVTLHCFIADRMGVSSGPVDHVDRGGLNCTRGNLRAATPLQNNANQAGKRGSRSMFKGVSWGRNPRGPGGRWVAQIQLNGKPFRLGRFVRQESAARVYDEWAKAAWGDFAYLNFPEPT